MAPLKLGPLWSNARCAELEQGHRQRRRAVRQPREDGSARADVDARAARDAVAAERRRRDEQQGGDRREEQPADADAVLMVVVVVMVVVMAGAERAHERHQPRAASTTMPADRSATAASRRAT